MTDSEKAQYNTVAVEYKAYDDLPMAKLEAQLIRTALGDCKGFKILDLGGGTGTHARQAVDLGAEAVDVVDVATEMMQIGKDIEAQMGREGKIRWHTADAGKPMAEQGVNLPFADYDLVMANWVFDHAHTMEDLRGMWKNITGALKPGGKFLGIRVIQPGIFSEHVKVGTYGARYEDIDVIPGGLKCKVILMTNPPFSFGGTMMEDSYGMLNEVPKGMGMTDFKAVPAEEMGVVKSDPAFWQTHLAEPLFAVVTARKV